MRARSLRCAQATAPTEDGWSLDGPRERHAYRTIPGRVQDALGERTRLARHLQPAGAIPFGFRDRQTTRLGGPTGWDWCAAVRGSGNRRTPGANRGTRTGARRTVAVRK